MATENTQKVEMLINTYVKEPNLKAIEVMLEDLGEQFFIAPASTRKDIGYAYKGGLVEQSLRVCYHLNKLNESMGCDVPKESLAIVGLFHQLGKAGLKGRNLYVPQESKWHRDKGIMYTVEEELKQFTVRDRTLYLLQQYDIKLSEYEYQALLSFEGQYSDENRAMRYKENSLSLLLHWAYIWTVTQEKK